MDEKETTLSRYAHETEASLPDVDVIRRAIDGDKDAFGELFQATYRRMFFVARHILSRDEDIYDALQIAYSKAYRYIGRVSPPENFYSWLAKIVENSAKDVWRDLHPNEELTPEIEEAPAPDVSEDADRRVVVARVLKEMDPRRAEVLALYYYDGLKLTEIAKLLGEPISTVHSRLKAAKRELTDLLAQRGIDRSFYSGGFFSAIAVALRSVLGTDILSAAVAQKMMDEVLSGKPGRLDVAAAKLAERQRNKAILRITGVLLLLVVIIALLTSALVNGWFIHRDRPTGAPTTTVLGAVSDGTTTTASTTLSSADETTGGSVSAEGETATTGSTLLTESGGTTTASVTGVLTPSSTTLPSGTTLRGQTTATTTTTRRPVSPNRTTTTKPTTTTTTTKPTTTTTTKPTTTRPTTPPNDISDKLTYIVTGGKAIVTDCDNSVSGAVAIPASLGGVPVGKIASRAFEERELITAITLPDTVTEIGSNAFSSCDALERVTFGNGLKTIKENAFASCWMLEEIVLPDSVTTVEDWAFFGAGVKSMTLGKGTTNYTANAMIGCTQLEEINVRAGNPVFHSAGNCLIRTATKTLVQGTHKSVIPTDGSVTIIGHDSFQHIHGLKKLTIPAAIRHIESMAFDSVKELHIADLKAWCSVSFDYSGDNPMTYAQEIYIEGEKATGKVVIPQGVTKIGYGTFYRCSMTIVEIPESVTEIENQAFSYCRNLVVVSLPKSVKTIGASAFDGCERLSDVEYAGSASDRSRISIGNGNDDLTNATWTYEQ